MLHTCDSKEGKLPGLCDSGNGNWAANYEELYFTNSAAVRFLKMCKIWGCDSNADKCSHLMV